MSEPFFYGVISITKRFPDTVSNGFFPPHNNKKAHMTALLCKHKRFEMRRVLDAGI